MTGYGTSTKKVLEINLKRYAIKSIKMNIRDAEVKRVRVQHGDGGIDVYIDYPDKFIVVQCKFLLTN